MYLKILGIATLLAAPTVTFKHALAQFAIRFRVQFYSALLHCRVSCSGLQSFQQFGPSLLREKRDQGLQ